MKLVVTLEKDESGTYVVECPSIPGCISQGQTESEALANIREAIQACIEARIDNGLPVTIETREIEVAI
jgi:predicted RNase H-like HicB family nuclease